MGLLWSILLGAGVLIASLGMRPRDDVTYASTTPTTTIRAPVLDENFIPPRPKPPELMGIPRRAILHTHIPDRPNQKISTHTVQSGDTAWTIAQKYNLQPETI
jgi:nucleoid-associated protein YgaU